MSANAYQRRRVLPSYQATPLNEALIAPQMMYNQEMQNKQALTEQLKMLQDLKYAPFDSDIAREKDAHYKSKVDSLLESEDLAKISDEVFKLRNEYHSDSDINQIRSNNEQFALYQQARLKDPTMAFSHDLINKDAINKRNPDGSIGQFVFDGALPTADWRARIDKEFANLSPNISETIKNGGYSIQQDPNTNAVFFVNSSGSKVTNEEITPEMEQYLASVNRANSIVEGDNPYSNYARAVGEGDDVMKEYVLNAAKSRIYSKQTGTVGRTTSGTVLYNPYAKSESKSSEEEEPRTTSGQRISVFSNNTAEHINMSKIGDVASRTPIENMELYNGIEEQKRNVMNADITDNEKREKIESLERTQYRLLSEARTAANVMQGLENRGLRQEYEYFNGVHRAETLNNISEYTNGTSITNSDLNTVYDEFLNSGKISNFTVGEKPLTKIRLASALDLNTQDFTVGSYNGNNMRYVQGLSGEDGDLLLRSPKGSPALFDPNNLPNYVKSATPDGRIAVLKNDPDLNLILPSENDEKAFVKAANEIGYHTEKVKDRFDKLNNQVKDLYEEVIDNSSVENKGWTFVPGNTKDQDQFALGDSKYEDALSTKFTRNISNNVTSKNYDYYIMKDGKRQSLESYVSGFFTGDESASVDMSSIRRAIQVQGWASDLSRQSGSDVVLKGTIAGELDGITDEGLKQIKELDILVVPKKDFINDTKKEIYNNIVSHSNNALEIEDARINLSTDPNLINFRDIVLQKANASAAFKTQESDQIVYQSKNGDIAFDIETSPDGRIRLKNIDASNLGDLTEQEVVNLNMLKNRLMEYNSPEFFNKVVLLNF